MRPNFFPLLGLDASVEEANEIASAIDQFESHWTTRRALELDLDDSEANLALVPEMRRVMLDSYLRSLERTAASVATRGAPRSTRDELPPSAQPRPFPRVSLAKEPSIPAAALAPIPSARPVLRDANTEPSRPVTPAPPRPRETNDEPPPAAAAPPPPFPTHSEVTATPGTVRRLHGMLMVAGTALIVAAFARAAAPAAATIRSTGMLALLGAALAGDQVVRPTATWKERRWFLAPLGLLAIALVCEISAKYL